MRRPILLVLALATSAAVAGAQGLSSAALRGAPQFTSLELDQGGTKTTISEIAVPIAFVLPLSSRLTFDLATAFANSKVESGGAESTISGLTDTQLRLNYVFGLDAVVVTAGVNLPTGQYEVSEDKLAAAGQIGNDFFSFPVSSFGNGLAGTGGIALARALGDWNLGLGASFRKSAEFGAFGTGTNEVRFEPADEIRIRAGLDRFVGAGRILLAAVYSQFGEDAVSQGSTSATTYSTGNRIIGQAALDVPVGGANFFLAGWVLNRAEGETIGGTAPPEMIMNVQAALGFNLGGLFLEPSFEARSWSIDGEAAGTLMYGGLRTRFDLGPIQVSPSAAYGTGTLDVSGADITGLKGGVTFRIGG